MRQVQNAQRELGLPQLRDIRVPEDARDDLPAVLPGFQLLRADRGFRRAVFRILDKKILPHYDRGQGRPGMGPLSVLILGSVKQAKRPDFDSLQDLANHRLALRQFLGHPDIRDKRRCKLETLEQNVNLPRPRSSGRSACRPRARSRDPGTSGRRHPVRSRRLFRGGARRRCPTDISLLRDAVRSLILRSNTWAKERRVSGARESEDDKKKLEKAFTRVRKEMCANRSNVKSYLFFCFKRARNPEKSSARWRPLGLPDPGSRNSSAP